jgi:phage terminase Nu1 subunit (DNA packaging protein)
MSADPPSRLSLTEYAAHRGVSRQTVYKYLQRGLFQRGEDQLIDVTAADRALDERPAASSAPRVRMTVTEYAKHRGVSRGTISTYIDKGFIERRPDKRIDVAAADALLDANADTSGDPDRLVSVSEYARRRGVTRQAVYKYLDRGLIERRPDRLIDVHVANRQLDARRDMTRVRKAPPPAAPSSAGRQSEDSVQLEARTRFEVARARKMELQAAQLEGSLVARDKVERQVFELGRVVSERLLALPDRLADRLAALDDRHACHALMSEELRAALEALTDLEQLTEAGGGVVDEDDDEEGEP